MTRRHVLSFSVCLLLLLLSPDCLAWTAKYDLHFKHWGEFYFPFDDWRWWKSQSMAESELDPFAKSPVGAQGLMQLMPATAADLGVRNPYDPEANIQGGIKYDKWLTRYWRKIESADDLRDFLFASYNAGPGHILKANRKSGGKKWETTAAFLPSVTGKHAKETIGYVKRIHRYYNIIR